MTAPKETARTTSEAPPIRGLLHGPHPAQWDSDTEIWGPDWRSSSGHTDGWWWATDSFSLCGIKEGPEFDEDDADQTPTGAKAVEYLSADVDAPLYAAEPRDLSIIGGIARLRDWGIWDLDRVCDAASWVIGDDGRRVVLAVDRKLQSLRIIGPSGRVAVVMGVRESDGWFPAIDLPVVDAVDAARQTRTEADR